MPFRRLYRGSLSSLGVPVAAAGKLCAPLLRPLRSPERLERGLILLLPGIESESFLSHSVAWGLRDAGRPEAIEIFDWTTGFPVWFPYHLRSWRRNQRRAALLAERIVAYRQQYPGRPVTIIGHSGGGAIALLTAAAVPADHPVTRIILLLPAISPDFSLIPALSRCEQGIWHFRSVLDLLFLGVGTMLLGTVDGHHRVSAGNCGFRRPRHLTAAENQLYDDQLHEIPYHPRMVTGFNLGGHFGCTNRVFVAEWIAPLCPNSAAKPSISA